MWSKRGATLRTPVPENLFLSFFNFKSFRPLSPWLALDPWWFNFNDIILHTFCLALNNHSPTFSGPFCSPGCRIEALRSSGSPSMITCTCFSRVAACWWSTYSNKRGDFCKKDALSESGRKKKDKEKERKKITSSSLRRIRKSTSSMSCLPIIQVLTSASHNAIYIKVRANLFKHKRKKKKTKARKGRTERWLGHHATVISLMKQIIFTQCWWWSEWLEKSESKKTNKAKVQKRSML